MHLRRPFHNRAGQPIVLDDGPLELFAEHIGIDLREDGDVSEKSWIALMVRTDDGRNLRRIETAFHEIDGWTMHG